MIWIALALSALSLATALVALWWAHSARAATAQPGAKRSRATRLGAARSGAARSGATRLGTARSDTARLSVARLSAVWSSAARSGAVRPIDGTAKRPDAGIPWGVDDPATAEPDTADRNAPDGGTADPSTADPSTADPSTADPNQRRLIAAAADSAADLSGACHAVIRALDAGGEPPASSDYARVHRFSELFSINVERIRSPERRDALRELTDELVTLHHCVVTEVRQHQEARFPFVGAKDTTLAGQMLRRFDAEVARLRLYARTGFLPEPSGFPVDFETVRFVPRPPPNPQ